MSETVDKIAFRDEVVESFNTVDVGESGKIRLLPVIDTQFKEEHFINPGHGFIVRFRETVSGEIHSEDLLDECCYFTVIHQHRCHLLDGSGQEWSRVVGSVPGQIELKATIDTIEGHF